MKELEKKLIEEKEMREKIEKELEDKNKKLNNQLNY